MTEPRDPADDQTVTSWPAELTPPDPESSGGGLAPLAPPPPPPSGQGVPPPWLTAGSGMPPAGYSPYTNPASGWGPPPVTHSRSVPGAPGLAYAGTMVRIVAYLLDGLILSMIAFGVLVLYGLVAGVGGATGPAGQAGTLVTEVIFLAVQAAYFTFGWSGASRATPGMRALGLQIGHEGDGRRLTRGEGLRRWVAMGFWIEALGFTPDLAGLVTLVFFGWLLALVVSTAMHPIGQGLHDRFASTLIVVSEGRSNRGLLIGCLVLLALPILAIVALIFLGGQVSSVVKNVGT